MPNMEVELTTLQKSYMFYQLSQPATLDTTMFLMPSLNAFHIANILAPTYCVLCHSWFSFSLEPISSDILYILLILSLCISSH